MRLYFYILGNHLECQECFRKQVCDDILHIISEIFSTFSQCLLWEIKTRCSFSSQLKTYRCYTNFHSLNEVTQLPGKMNENVSEVAADVVIILLVYFDHRSIISNNNSHSARNI